MAGIWALDSETIMRPPKPILDLRHREFLKLQEEIELDRPPEAKGNRRYIAQNLTDPEKIDKAIWEKLEVESKLERDADALNPLTATPVCIVCINSIASLISEMFAVIDNPPENMVEVFTGVDKFYLWAEKEAQRFIGFNIKNFDLPVLRAHLIRTNDGKIPDIPALWKAPIDVAELIFAPYDRSPYSTPRSLRYHVASLLSHEAQRPGPVKEYLESDFSGKDVAAAYLDEEHGGMDKIIRHCTLDALMAALIAHKLGIC